MNILRDKLFQLMEDGLLHNKKVLQNKIARLFIVIFIGKVKTRVDSRVLFIYIYSDTFLL